MPRMDGMEVLRRLRQTASTPVIILTSKDEEIDEILGFNLGADDYIHKPFSQRLLIERVKAICAGPADAADAAAAGGAAAAASARAIKRGKLTLDPERHDCLWEGKPVKLTVTEFLLLQALAQRPGFVKSRDNLMDAAYEDQVYVDDRTIDSHIKRMRKKFRQVDPTFDAIETLYGVGYRYRETRASSIDPGRIDRRTRRRPRAERPRGATRTSADLAAGIASGSADRRT